MNTPELFILGALVTAMVALALGLVVYGAIMDGRDARRVPGGPDPSPADASAPAPDASARHGLTRARGSPREVAQPRCRAIAGSRSQRSGRRSAADR